MKTNYLLQILVAIGLVSILFWSQRSPASPPLEKNWYTDLNKATEQSGKTGKLLMVDFSASWCSPCQLYRQQVFPTGAFKDATKDVVLVDIDIDEQPQLAAKYEVSGIPDIRFLTPDGKEVGRTVGYAGSDGLLEALAKAKSALR